YHYSSQNAFNLVCLVAMMLFLLVGILFGAPLIWLLVVVVPFFGLLWYVWAGIEFSLQITKSAICWRAGRDSSSAALADIEHVKITDWNDSSDVDVVLKTGASLRVPSQCYPKISKLKAALRERLIVVIDA
ncbi:MAG: hypothetical protein AAGG02_12145, partial [Cyanobacteria bacterium P01_H01_bin.15]